MLILARLAVIALVLMASVALGQPVPDTKTQSAEREAEILESLSNQHAHPTQYAGGDFRSFVGRALGFPRAKRSVSAVAPGQVEFRKPDLIVHFESVRKGKSKLAMLVHGHRSSPARLLSTATDDGVSAREALQRKGFDIAAPSVTSDPVLSSLINLRLTGMGIQIYGLWAAAICAYADEVKDEYDEILLYGFSNGAIISGYTGTLCGANFSKVIIDDFLSDMVQALHIVNQTTEYLYFYHTLGDFLRGHRFVDVMIHGQAPTFLIANRDNIEGYLNRPLAPEPRRTTLGKRDVNFVYRPGKEHVRSIDILLAIAADDYSSLKGWSMARP